MGYGVERVHLLPVLGPSAGARGRGGGRGLATCLVTFAVIGDCPRMRGGRAARSARRALGAAAAEPPGAAAAVPTTSATTRGATSTITCSITGPIPGGAVPQDLRRAAAGEFPAAVRAHAAGPARVLPPPRPDLLHARLRPPRARRVPARDHREVRPAAEAGDRQRRSVLRGRPERLGRPGGGRLLFRCAEAVVRGGGRHAVRRRLHTIGGRTCRTCWRAARVHRVSLARGWHVVVANSFAGLGAPMPRADRCPACGIRTCSGARASSRPPSSDEGDNWCCAWCPRPMPRGPRPCGSPSNSGCRWSRRSSRTCRRLTGRTSHARAPPVRAGLLRRARAHGRALGLSRAALSRRGSRGLQTAGSSTGRLERSPQ